MSNHRDHHSSNTPLHSILKKPHPASLSETPRSRSKSPSHSRDSSYSNSEINLSGLQTNIHPSDVGHAASQPIHPSPLRTESHSAGDDTVQAAAPTNLTQTSSASGSSSNPASVTFSVPNQSSLTAQATTSTVQPQTRNDAPAASPLPSILKLPSSSRSSRNSSRRSSLSQSTNNQDGIEGEGSVDTIAAPNQLQTALLQLPTNDDSSPSQVSSASSIQRSASPSLAYDRTRLVGGKGGYGGRRGGPALNKNRTSSSGGLSDIDIRPNYERKVGFDTMIDADDTPNGYFTFCLQVKSRGYLRTKNTRTFMCAVDDNGYSERALEWLMESLVSDGDEIVALRVLEGDAEEIDQDAAREDARELMASIVELNDEFGDRSISIVVEFIAGRVTDTILNVIYVYRPDSITVGTRGRTMSTFQKMLGGSFIGSCSRDILNLSPVPVVIVRPEAKVKKHLAKRQNDPKRRSYHDLVALSKESHLPLSVGHSKRQSLLSVPHKH
ncbi:hypothetical protein L7F22_039439 [Adiantum nelumboides]|nr:hypothetical protein [Adiantum nelumboides]